jgi:L,D-peptidoglycan transpeptidase YkuD (ErfK/YbiS/YcfS/YnhG family)
MGWCNDINSPHYNQLVTLPHTATHEKLWRDDARYDMIIVLAYNDAPVIKGKGSAIFLHVAADNYPPTAGCIALSKTDLLTVLPYFTSNTRLHIPLMGDLLII